MQMVKKFLFFHVDLIRSNAVCYLHISLSRVLRSIITDFRFFFCVCFFSNICRYMMMVQREREWMCVWIKANPRLLYKKKERVVLDMPFPVEKRKEQLCHFGSQVEIEEKKRRDCCSLLHTFISRERCCFRLFMSGKISATRSAQTFYFCLNLQIMFVVFK